LIPAPLPLGREARRPDALHREAGRPFAHRPVARRRLGAAGRGGMHAQGAQPAAARRRAFARRPIAGRRLGAAGRGDMDAQSAQPAAARRRARGFLPGSSTPRIAGSGTPARISHQREAVGPGHRKGGALAPPKLRASFLFSPRLPHSPAPAGLCGRRGRATSSGPCSGGAKAPPFPSVVRNSG
jgi:hypothetical protein